MEIIEAVDAGDFGLSMMQVSFHTLMILMLLKCSIPMAVSCVQECTNEASKKRMTLNLAPRAAESISPELKIGIISKSMSIAPETDSYLKYSREQHKVLMVDCNFKCGNSLITTKKSPSSPVTRKASVLWKRKKHWKLLVYKGSIKTKCFSSCKQLGDSFIENKLPFRYNQHDQAVSLPLDIAPLYASIPYKTQGKRK
ncbi:hypothetical protein H6P81_014510 [Aristolochia fimbriata]|uniref:Uncharacterized protein n=1 Tax=Aristolochia fimbriata TaxID=158543 RepID=A0AAV7EL03_ARIFI|nr:hypothetical protein H6P81_014510 [Aristolochia fimbriata]